MTHLFSSLFIRNWRQFRWINIRVHPRATILTGANGAGKSTVLNIFAQHVGFNKPLVGTPKRRVGGTWVYETGVYEVSAEEELAEQQDSQATGGSPYEIEGLEKALTNIGGPPHQAPDMQEIGFVSYDNGHSSGVSAPKFGNAYGLLINMQQPVVGAYVSPHKIVAPYQAVQSLNLQGINVDQAYLNYQQELNARYHGQHTGLSPLYRIKEAIIALAAFGEGNTFLQGNAQLLAIFDEFIQVLRIMLPEELKFETIFVRVPDIVLKTRTGEFVIDASSGGIGSLVELSWQLLIFSKTAMAAQLGGKFVVVMDEPENHLHPTMQRTILPKLLAAFPNAQFIVATHSPFVVSSVEDSYVYALRYRETQLSADSEDSEYMTDRVYSTLLNNVTKSGTASDIFREVLGVPVTFPEWAEEKIDQIVERLSEKTLSKDTIDALRTELAAGGLKNYYPQALDRLVSRV